MYDEKIEVRNFYYFYFIGRNFLVCIIVKFNFFQYSYCSHSSFWLCSFFLIVSFPFFTQAHPNHAQFLNKKIEMFDKMALVVGKDMATRGFSKGVCDIGVEALDDSPPLVDADVDDISKKKQVDPSHVASNEQGLTGNKVMLL